MFCIFLRTVVDDFPRQLQLKLCAQNSGLIKSSIVTILAYVDDVVLSLGPVHLDLVWPIWIATLVKHGYKVESTKQKQSSR